MWTNHLREQRTIDERPMVTQDASSVVRSIDESRSEVVVTPAACVTFNPHRAAFVMRNERFFYLRSLVRTLYRPICVMHAADHVHCSTTANMSKRGKDRHSMRLGTAVHRIVFDFDDKLDCRCNIPVAAVGWRRLRCSSLPAAVRSRARCEDGGCYEVHRQST